MSLAPVIHLEPEDIVDDHPFTHPKHISGDVNCLRYQVDQLCLFLENRHRCADRPRPIIVHRPGTERWVYRLVIAQPEQLMKPVELSFVGFLGQRRSDANKALADEFDRILLEEIPDHPGLLSYSTMALISGNYSNLVVFSDPAVKEQWSRSKAHAQAVGKLAPDFYLSVRLYNGRLPNGIHDSDGLCLTCVKYFDYQGGPGWQAVRVFENGSSDGQA